MAKANLPPIKIPPTLLTDQLERAYFQQLNFAVYQIYQRTGGGDDLFDSLQVQITINKNDIDTLDVRVTVNEVDIALLKDQVADLEQGFSWKLIPADKAVTISVNQQMIVVDGITVDGELTIDGELSLL